VSSAIFSLEEYDDVKTKLLTIPFFTTEPYQERAQPVHGWYAVLAQMEWAEHAH